MNKSRRASKMVKRAPLLCALVPLTVAVALAGCGPGAAGRTATPPACRPDNRTLILMAQAVPTAARVPCISAAEGVWSISSMEVRNGMVRFSMWTDRFAQLSLADRPPASAGESPPPGLAAPLLITFARHCDPPGEEQEEAAAATQLFVDAAALAERYMGIRSYLFRGGCVQVRFNFPLSGQEKFGAVAWGAIALMPRAAIEGELARQGFRL